MSVTTTTALQALAQALDAPRRDGVALGNWRWTVRRRLVAVRDALVAERAGPRDGWLAARAGAVLRERNALLARLAELAPRVLAEPEVEPLRIELKRLVADIDHHFQRIRDLAWDDVEMELGGSE